MKTVLYFYIIERWKWVKLAFRLGGFSWLKVTGVKKSGGYSTFLLYPPIPFYTNPKRRASQRRKPRKGGLSA